MMATHGDGVRTLIPTSPFHVVSATWGFALAVLGGSVMLPGFRSARFLSPRVLDLIEQANPCEATEGQHPPTHAPS